MESLKEKRRCREILLKCDISEKDIEMGLKRGDYKEIFYEEDVLLAVEQLKANVSVMPLKVKDKIRIKRHIKERFG